MEQNKWVINRLILDIVQLVCEYLKHALSIASLVWSWSHIDPKDPNTAYIFLHRFIVKDFFFFFFFVIEKWNEKDGFCLVFSPFEAVFSCGTLVALPEGSAFIAFLMFASDTGDTLELQTNI